LITTTQAEVERMSKLSELVKLLQTELEQNGDADLKVRTPTQEFDLEVRPIADGTVDFLHREAGAETLDLWMDFSRLASST
jgi:hypothetical protein